MTGPRIIVALDFASVDEALAFTKTISPNQCRLKVGLELYTLAGAAFVRELIARGFDVFLDLKFHDIPNTVERACRQATSLGVWMLTVHCLGGRKMLEAARRGVGEGTGRPHLVGVTLLTSHDAATVREIGLNDEISQQVMSLARLAKTSGLDGVVCAPPEAGSLRAHLGPEFVLVTPGIRPAGSEAGDQQRVLTPAQAIAQGSDFLVVGRPITRATDARAALAAIEREIATA